MNKHKAETLVRTGPGTAMGNLMRRYWVPVLLSREIEEPDGPQVRVQILGEKLLAFRDTDAGRAHRRVLFAPRKSRSTSVATRRMASVVPIMA
jgi:hypothetical protein